MHLGELSSENLCFDWMGWVGKKGENIDQLPLFVWETLNREGEACNLPITPHFLNEGQTRDNVLYLCLYLYLCMYCISICIRRSVSFANYSALLYRSKQGTACLCFLCFIIRLICPSGTTAGFQECPMLSKVTSISHGKM